MAVEQFVKDKALVYSHFDTDHSSPKHSILNMEIALEQSQISFYTATILNWKSLLSQDKYKEIILSSLRYLVEHHRIKLYGFVIMPNHIHLLWEMCEGNQLEDVQRDFMKYTAQQIKQDLSKHHPQVLTHFKSTQKDRKYQFWERRPFNKLLYSRTEVEEKLDYIHHNPMQGKWMLANSLEEYRFSSYSFYELDDLNYDFLTHYMDEFI
jgi:REP element-mobilizing transposase RayT